MTGRLTTLCGLLAGFALTHCGGKTVRTDSTVQGHFDLASFPSAPVRVEATSEAGKPTSAAVEDGKFELMLERGHRYQLTIVLATGAEPLVFPRSGGSLDLDFDVTSGGAIVSLGAVRHYDSAPATGFYIQKGSATADGGPGECVDGHVLGSGEACVDDDAEVSCEADDENEQEGEHEDGDQQGSDGDAECENGVDLATGAACVDDAEADPSKPMAVAEHNIPDEVGGCSDEGEEDEEDD